MHAKISKSVWDKHAYHWTEIWVSPYNCKSWKMKCDRIQKWEKINDFVIVGFRNVSIKLENWKQKKNFRVFKVDLLDRTAFILSELKVKLASFLQ